jgi:hypothetical protein
MQAGCDFSGHSGRDQEHPEELLKERKLADLVERDEHARVGYDDCGHESMDACSAAQSSLVIWK